MGNIISILVKNGKARNTEHVKDIGNDEERLGCGEPRALMTGEGGWREMEGFARIRK